MIPAESRPTPAKNRMPDAAPHIVTLAMLYVQQRRVTILSIFQWTIVYSPMRVKKSATLESKLFGIFSSDTLYTFAAGLKNIPLPYDIAP